MDNRDRQARIERMKREKQRQERKRRHQVAMIKRCVAIAIGVAVLLLFIVGVWALVKPLVQKKEAQTDHLANQADLEQEETGATNPNDEANLNDEPTPAADVDSEGELSEDGLNQVLANDGPAAQKPIANPQELKHAVPGWQVDDGGWWYANSDNTYYENGWATLEGKKYFFDATGYMQTGWAPIGGKGYFFDDAGQHQVDKKPKMVALTFDDGPGRHTSRLLDILEENNAKATFFMVGESLEKEHGHLVNRMMEDGHQLGNHTYTHANLTKLSEEDIRLEFSKVDDKLNELAPGAKSTLTRPPYGAKNESVLSNIETPAIFWDIDTNDWQTKDAKSITEIATNVTEGNIILMHDIHETTVEACETIIPKLIEAGYELVTISEMAKAHGVELKVGVPYYSFTEDDLAKINAAAQAEDTSETSE